MKYYKCSDNSIAILYPSGKYGMYNTNTNEWVTNIDGSRTWAKWNAIWVDNHEVHEINEEEAFLEMI
jgi:hypothetical protein